MPDSTWLILWQQGAIVEEAGEDEGDNCSFRAEDESDEKDVPAEKVALHLQNIGIGGVDVTNLEGYDIGTGKEIRLGRPETDPHALS